MVEAAEVALIVHRYLRQNGFVQTVESFEEDAKDLLQSLQGSSEPLPLQHILNEFVRFQSEEADRNRFVSSFSPVRVLLSFLSPHCFCHHLF